MEPLPGAFEIFIFILSRSQSQVGLQPRMPIRDGRKGEHPHTLPDVNVGPDGARHPVVSLCPEPELHRENYPGLETKGSETSKTLANKRRKRPISSLYTLDELVNKTTSRGMGGERG